MMTNTLAKLTTLAVGAGLSGSLAVADGVYRGYETPRYTVVQSISESVEIRAYRPHLLAEVTVRGDRGAALRSGFQVLAGYIFGGNATAASVAMTSPVSQSETIAMTAPVSQQIAGDVWTVTFMMPSAYSAETLPTPSNGAIRFTQTQAEQHIVLTFSGYASDAALAEREAELRRIARIQSIAIVGGPIFHYFDDPMTLPWRRRNEVAFVIED